MVCWTVCIIIWPSPCGTEADDMLEVSLLSVSNELLNEWLDAGLFTKVSSENKLFSVDEKEVSSVDTLLDLLSYKTVPRLAALELEPLVDDFVVESIGEKECSLLIELVDLTLVSLDAVDLMFLFTAGGGKPAMRERKTPFPH